MAKIGKKGSGKRFGVRYGKKLRDKVSAVDAKKKALYKCPKCNKIKVRRLFTGIWKCGSCETKFAGKAYSLK